VDNIRNFDTNEFGEMFNVDEPEDFCEETTAQPETKKSAARAALAVHTY
jgi:hypothetical protein